MQGHLDQVVAARHGLVDGVRRPPRRRGDGGPASPVEPMYIPGLQPDRLEAFEDGDVLCGVGCFSHEKSPANSPICGLAEVYQIGRSVSGRERPERGRPRDPLAQLLVGDPGRERRGLRDAPPGPVRGRVARAAPPGSRSRLGQVALGEPERRRRVIAERRLQPLEDPRRQLAELERPDRRARVRRAASRRARPAPATRSRATSSPTTAGQAATIRGIAAGAVEAAELALDLAADPLHHAATARPGVTSTHLRRLRGQRPAATSR